MLETGVVLFRLLQFAGGSILFGVPLFFLTTFPCGAAWIKSLLWTATAVLLVATLLGLIAQTGVLAGSLAEALKPATLDIVLAQTNFGRAGVLRLAAAGAVAVLLFFMPPGRPLWRAVLLGGAIGSASMAWMGHGGATEGAMGPIHLAGDIFHLLAAAGWIGALVCFSLLLIRPADRERALDGALSRFAGIGAGLVAVILATGLVNAYFLVSFGRLSGLWTTPYGLLLSFKLLLFCAMLGFALTNRLVLTPALARALSSGGPVQQKLAALRRSVIAETVIGVIVLGLVAWLGTLAPIAGP
jgi:putative copper resistance protein D